MNTDTKNVGTFCIISDNRHKESTVRLPLRKTQLFLILQWGDKFQII